MKPSLEGPVQKHLAPALDDAAVDRIGRALRAEQQAPSPARRWAVVALAAAMLAGGVVTWRLLGSTEPAVLALEGGAPLPASLGGAQAQAVAFSDGSAMTLEPEAKVEVVANQPSKLTVLVQQGRARFEVNPKAKRQWLVEAELLTVEVVGTVFTVDRGADGVSVNVERGTVLVRGEGVPNRLVRLDAGMRTFVAAAKVEAPKPDVDALLVEADAARTRGDSERAAKALAQVLEVAGGDARAAVAAFTLARLELEALGRPREAAAHFAQAAAHPAAGPLEEDALARRIEALSAAGESTAAKAATSAFLARFPTGAHAEALRRGGGDR